MSMCWSEGSYVHWPSTPGGNEIAQVSLSPEDVVSTAQEMMTIASSMRAAANTLRELAGSDDGQQGKAIEKLRDSVGETWDILEDAGDLYYGTADAIGDYGRKIGDEGIAEALQLAYATAEEKWSAYAGANGDLFGDITVDAGDDDPDAASDAAENKAKYDAFQAWMDAANHWDQQYDDWETAWNAAVTAIETAHAHGPKDGWDEWWGDILEVAYIVLTAAGIVVGILALIFGGPALLLMSAIVGVVIAGIAVARYARGETDLFSMIVDIACAVPGVGPLAKLMSKMGPLAMRAGVGAAGLTGEVASRVFPPIVFGRNFASPAENLILHGSVGVGLLFDMPNALRLTDSISTALAFTAPYIVLNGVYTFADYFLGEA